VKVSSRRASQLQSRPSSADYEGVDSRATLPTGVITFLLTDVEGSTRLWEREPEAMRDALARHDAIVAACVRRQQGHVVKSKGEGDSVFAVFRHARDAVTAALVIQCALAMEKWRTSVPVRVRMAIHTGQVELREGDYYGPTVNRCARLRALGKGGQVLLSGVTAKLVEAQLPAGARLNDLGTHQLKDLSAPERVWQLTHPQMASVTASGSEAKLDASTALVAYVLTDHANRDTDGREWGGGTTHTANGQASGIRCYTSPKLAAVLNLLHERFRLPRLWEAAIDHEAEPGEATVECARVTTRRQVTMPSSSAHDLARFAVLCAQAASDGDPQLTDFRHWADGWLAGQDASGVQAREISNSLESDATGEESLAQPELRMAANAARAAHHSARTSWLAGRARDEENARAIELSAEAIDMALRLVQLDLRDLADRAIRSSSPTSVPPGRVPALR
jgi:class 3 adenylate cyclase